MTMKSLYIVYITNCFLWTMSDNKAYLILSYLILFAFCTLSCYKQVQIKVYMYKQ